MTITQKTEGKARAIGYFDVSASTVLWHEARSRDQDEEGGRCQEELAQALAAFFSVAIKDAVECGVHFVNTTGDGFLTVSHSTYWSRQTGGHNDPNYHPAQAMYSFSRSVQVAFEENVRSAIKAQRFVCRRSVQLRVSLHYGTIHKLDNGDGVHFFGDPLNYASRLLDSGVARRNHVACSRIFFARYHRRGLKDIGPPAETLSDRNKYPEPIDVYDLHDPQAAGNRIERVREYQNLSRTELERVVSDVSRVNRLLSGASQIKGRGTPSSSAFSFVPKGGQKPTIVEFLVEPKQRRRCVVQGPGTKLKVRQTGFELHPRSIWQNELDAWEERLKLIGQPDPLGTVTREDL